jgi:hypothetical protein
MKPSLPTKDTNNYCCIFRQSEKTTPRTALDRSILAITAGVASPPKKKALANNPYHLLADQEDMDVCPLDSKAKEHAHELEKGELSENEADSVSTGGAQYTLRKIRSLKKALADNSLRAEIEEVLGEDSLAPKSHENVLASSLKNNPQMEMDTQEDNASAGGRNSEKTQMASCCLSISPGCDPVMGDNRAKQ